MLAVVLGALGSFYSLRGIAAFVEGERWAMLGKSREGPMSPTVTLIVGILFLAGAVYTATRKVKPRHESDKS